MSQSLFLFSDCRNVGGISGDRIIGAVNERVISNKNKNDGYRAAQTILRLPVFLFALYERNDCQNDGDYAENKAKL
jgi:hypothetical protein